MKLQWEFAILPPWRMSQQWEVCIACGKKIREGDSWRVRAKRGGEMVYGGLCSEEEYKEAAIALLAKLDEGRLITSKWRNRGAQCM